MTFRERYMAGEAAFDEIFDLTDEWMAGDAECTLAVYLGLNDREEDIWISQSDEALEEFMEKEKTRKALFTDLDNTLLSRTKELTAGNRAAIDGMLKDDHYLVLTTGRVFPSALQIAKKYKLMRQGVFIICGNGSRIYDIGRKKTLHDQTLDREVIEKACAVAKECGIYIQGYNETYVLAESKCEELDTYCRIQALPYEVVEDLPAACGNQSAKLLAISKTPEQAADFRQKAREALDGVADIFNSTPYYVEIVPKGVNKGAALEKLCHHLGIPVSQSISAGDEENDIPMLKAAGHGCAMSNAIDMAKEAADYITAADCDHDGIAEIIEKFV